MSRTTSVLFHALVFAAAFFSALSAIQSPDSIQSDRSQLVSPPYLGDSKMQSYRHRPIRKPFSRTTMQPVATLCQRYQDLPYKGYHIYNNLWGEDKGQGKQCTSLYGVGRNGVIWSSEWTWNGGSGQVKSYANVQRPFQSIFINDLRTIPTHWSWRYDKLQKGTVANVAYDMMTEPYGTNGPKYEIMIWLARIGGAGPISRTGQPLRTVKIGSTYFDLFEGFPQGLITYSFVPVKGGILQEFQGNLFPFLLYLKQQRMLPGDAKLATIGAGTEPFEGSGTFVTTSLFIDI